MYCWIWFANILLRTFTSIFIRDIGQIILSCGILVWFWYLSSVAIIKWVWKCSSYYYWFFGGKTLRRICISPLSGRIYLWNPLAMLQKERPLPGSESGLLSNTRKWIVQGDTHADEARDFIGGGAPRQRPGREGNPGGLLCQIAHSLEFYGGRISFRIVSGESFWLRVLPGGTHIVQPKWIPLRRILGSQ